MEFFGKTLIMTIAAAAVILFIAVPAYSHGGEDTGEKHSTPKPVVPVMEGPAYGMEESAHGMEESTHGGENHHAPATVEPTMEEESDHHGAKQRLKKYAAEELRRGVLNKAKAEASEQKAIRETEKLKYRTAAAVFGIFILIIGLVLRYAPGRAYR